MHVYLKLRTSEDKTANTIHRYSHRKTETNPHVWNANYVIIIKVHYFRQLWYTFITYNRLPTSPF